MPMFAQSIKLRIEFIRNTGDILQYPCFLEFRIPHKSCISKTFDIL